MTGKVSDAAASAFSCDKSWFTFITWAVRLLPLSDFSRRRYLLTARTYTVSRYQRLATVVDCVLCRQLLWRRNGSVPWQVVQVSRQDAPTSAAETSQAQTIRRESGVGTGPPRASQLVFFFPTGKRLGCRASIVATRPLGPPLSTTMPIEYTSYATPGIQVFGRSCESRPSAKCLVSLSRDVVRLASTFSRARPRIRCSRRVRFLSRFATDARGRYKKDEARHGRKSPALLGHFETLNLSPVFAKTSITFVEIENSGAPPALLTCAPLTRLNAFAGERKGHRVKEIHDRAGREGRDFFVSRFSRPISSSSLALDLRTSEREDESTPTDHATTPSDVNNELGFRQRESRSRQCPLP